MPQLSLKIEQQPTIRLQISKSRTVHYEDPRVDALQALVASITAKRTTYPALAGVYYAGEQSYTYHLGWSEDLLAHNPVYGLSTVSAAAPAGGRLSNYRVLKIPSGLAGKRGRLSLFFGSIEAGEPDSSSVGNIPSAHKYFLFRLRDQVDATWEVINATGQDVNRFRIVHDYEFLGGEKITFGTTNSSGTAFAATGNRSNRGKGTALEVSVYEQGIIYSPPPGA